MYLPRNVAVQLICLVLTFVVCVSGQDTKTGTKAAQRSDCESQKTCDKCISTAYCKWCSATDDERAKSTWSGQRPPARCVHASIPKESWCPNDQIIDPSVEQNVTGNDEFSNVLKKEVQLRPQSLSVKLRAGQEHKVKIDYKQAQGYPVDLYFLMDLSYSMEAHRDKLSGLGEQLATAMRSITSNFKLGFGSFVDKYILPMTSTQPEWLKRYCTLKDHHTQCATPYDFKHQMTLTSDYLKFKAQVAAAPISGNIDNPEGGLDALMQAMVCDEIIGWRKKARHIIVYSSDATYHIAGDGRLAGLIEPNDEQCHLNKEGYYDQAEILDYPSISQIKKIAHDKSKNIIFAVTSGVSEEYKELSEVIKPGLEATGILQEGNSSNVVDLVKKFTEELTSNIRMTARVADKFADIFKIDYTSRPTGNSEGVECKKNSCSGISEKTPIEFEVSITALRCPELEADRHQRIELELDGIPEKVVIDVDIICSCGCSREVNSVNCTGNGDLACGVCECNPGYERDNCSCRVHDSEQGDLTTCKAPGSNLTCSGHGHCNSCGVCKCDDGPNEKAGDKYSGEFCQCDNFLCPRTNYMPCGGPERGECVCGGQCKCKPGYEGDSCECETEKSCTQEGGNGKVCSGFGECECGKCQCTKDNKRSGKYCELCTICVNEFCDKYKDCVECLAYQTGPRYTKDGECSNCTDVQLEGKVDNFNETASGTAYCMGLDSASCTFAFAYTDGNKKGDHEKKIKVTAEKEKKCPPPAASPWTVAISAIALTLFLGLLGLIIWKILTMYHDHREWVKFEKERASAKWERGENPLFKGATTDFKNPTYEQQKTE